MGNTRGSATKLNMFNVMHSDGTGEVNPPVESLSDLYDELSAADREHGDVSVAHEESGWCLSAHRDGRVVLEHLRDGRPRHMIPVAKEQVIQLWIRLVDGDVEAILSEPWKEGYT